MNRRNGILALLACLVSGVLASGCGRQAPPPSDVAGSGQKPSEGARSSGSGPATSSSQSPDLSAYLSAEPSRQEKYDGALFDAINHLTEKQYPEALASLEAAKSIQDTEQVRQEIVRVKLLLEQQAAAQRTVDDIQIVLRDGKAEEASKLATAALQQYGGADVADRLGKLKRQADALAVSQLEDQAAKRARFRTEAEAALREKNLRAASIAFEQALTYGEDPAIRSQYAQTRVALARYDENRRKASELRRDPYQLEDAIALYEEAGRSWDTLQIRQELDECRLALHQRRDRISVADFEIRGDIGIPAAGRTIAEELLPAFKSRFDIVERAQLAKVLGELNLQASNWAEDEGSRRQIGELAKVRYLVLGSVTRMSGAMVSARVVDVRTGLVVQTARLTVASPEELIARLPQLARMLMMSDEQKIAFDSRLAQEAAGYVRPIEVVDIPPPPSPPTAVGGLGGLPPPIIAFSPRPPEFGGLLIEDFDRLPSTPPAAGGGLSVDLALPLKNRFLGLSVELGDDLFRRGRYSEAVKHFEFACSLYPDREDLRIRLDRCRPHLPPSLPLPDAPSPPIAIGGRPRLATVNFATYGDPAIVPPGLGPWSAEQIGPYFCPPYDVVDRGEVFWWMGRLGITVRDLMQNPAARRYLGRALNVRFFLLGTIRQSASFDVTTHLLDAEHGYLVGNARMHVHSPPELKLRLGELARFTLMDPRERQRFELEARAHEQLIVEGRQRYDRGEFNLALELFGKAGKNRPFSVEVQVLVDRCEVRSRQSAIEEARGREYQRAQAIAAELERRQRELARQAEAARIRAEQEAAAQAAVSRHAQEAQRRRAHDQLLVQARFHLQAKNFGLSIQLFESAAGLQQSDEVFRELAVARARAEEESRMASLAEQARREAESRRRREEQLALVRQQVEEARRQREAEDRARLAALEERDKAEYNRLVDEAQRLQTQQKHDQAVAALQTARRLRKTDEVERLLQQALVEQARAVAQKKDAAARAELEKKLAEEKTRREAAEAEAKRNNELYLAALQAAQKAVANKQFDVAVTKYNEAGKIFKTDAVLTGLKQVEEARAKETAVRDVILRREAEAAKRDAEFKRLLSEGQTALAEKQYARAIAALKQAKSLKPTDVEALTALSKAEQAREEQQALRNRQKEEVERQTRLAADAERKKQEAARVAAAEAQKRQEAESRLKNRPMPPARPEPPAKTDPPARPPVAPPAKTEPSRPMPPAKVAPPAKKPEEPTKKPPAKQPKDFDGWMDAAATFEKEKQWDEAVQAYGQALRLKPADRRATAALTNARYELQMNEGRENLKNSKFAAAAQDFEAALRLKPKDPEATRLLDQAKRRQPLPRD